MKKIRINWITLIVFAVVAGIYTGVMALIPAFRNTSLQDISISFEWWILFGILIILGSKSNKDAALKCFVFFLISQPLVYLTQIIFGSAGWDIFGYYKTWLVWTVLTLPMGYIGYYLKKDQWWGLLIMLPIWLLLGWHINMFMGETFSFFPNHLLSLIFCIITMFGYVFLIFKHKRERLLGTIICSLILAVCLVINLMQPKTYKTTILCNDAETPFDNSYNVEMDAEFGTLKIVEKDFDTEMGYCIEAEFKKLGQTTIKLKNDNREYLFDLTIDRNTYSITAMPIKDITE